MVTGDGAHPVQVSVPVAPATQTRLFRRVLIQADSGNVHPVSLGGSATTTSPTAGAQQGCILIAGANAEFTNVRLSDLWLNATNSGDAVTWISEGS